MAGFEWDETYTVLKKAIAKDAACSVGRYVVPKEAELPYIDIALEDNSGGNYDLSGNEGIQTPTIKITTYATGDLAGSRCNEMSNAAKKIMLSYGFTCKSGPVPVTNVEDTRITRWIARYQRVFGNGDTLRKLD